MPKGANVNEDKAVDHISRTEFWKVINSLEEKFENAIKSVVDKLTVEIGQIANRINDTREGSSDRISRITFRLMSVAVGGLALATGVMTYIATLHAGNAQLRVDFTQKMLEQEISHNKELVLIERQDREKHDDILRQEHDKLSEKFSSIFERVLIQEGSKKLD